MSSGAITSVIIFIIIVITASSMFSTKMKHDVEITRINEQTNHFKIYYEKLSSNAETYIKNTREMNELISKELVVALKAFSKKQAETTQSVNELKNEIETLKSEIDLLKTELKNRER